MFFFLFVWNVRKYSNKIIDNLMLLAVISEKYGIVHISNNIHELPCSYHL